MKWTGQDIYDFETTFRQGITVEAGLGGAGDPAAALTIKGSITFDSVTFSQIQTGSESFEF